MNSKVVDPRYNPNAWYLKDSIHDMDKKTLYDCLSALLVARQFVNPAHHIELAFLIQSRISDCKFYLDDKPKNAKKKMGNDRLFDPKDDRYGVINAVGPVTYE